MHCLPRDAITLQFNMILHLLDTIGNKQEILNIVKSTLVQCTCDYGMNKIWAMLLQILHLRAGKYNLQQCNYQK